MSKLFTCVLFFAALLPSTCVATTNNDPVSGDFWVKVLGSIIAGSILIIAFTVEERKKAGDKSLLYRQIDTTNIKKYLKKIGIFILLFLFFSIYITPEIFGKYSKYNDFTALAFTILTILVYKKYKTYKNGDKQGSKQS